MLDHLNATAKNIADFFTEIFAGGVLDALLATAGRLVGVLLHLLTVLIEGLLA
ncbi:hypothetical protein GCM10027048_06090 [Hymenobacter coalescens]